MPATSGRYRADVVDHMLRNEADPAFRKRAQTIFDWIRPQDDMTILDFPCGRGFYLNMLRHLCDCRLVGAELDPRVLAQAQHNVGHLPGLTLTRADVAAMPFADARFDAVILSEILEHVDDDFAALREAWRVLKPGGVLAVTVPNADYPFWWDPLNRSLESLFGTHIRTGPLAGIWANHVRLYKRDQFRAIVEAAGFHIEETRAFTHHSLPFLHNLLYGIGMPLLESGLLPKRMARAADRTAFAQPDAGRLNPVRLAISLIRWFDARNRFDEPAGRSTVNLAIKARKSG